MTSPSQRALGILIANLLLFFIARLGLWLAYQADFHELETVDLLRAFVHGEWFDLSVIAMVSGLPLLMLLLPFRWATHSAWSGLWIWLSYGLLVVLGLLLAADVVYFSFVHRHAGHEIVTLSADPQLLVDMAFGSYAWAVALYVVACAGLFLLWRRLFHKPVKTAARFASRLAVFVVAVHPVNLPETEMDSDFPGNTATNPRIIGYAIAATSLEPLQASQRKAFWGVASLIAVSAVLTAFLAWRREGGAHTRRATRQTMRDDPALTAHRRPGMAAADAIGSSGSVMNLFIADSLSFRAWRACGPL